ncbi:hypothetical protein ACFFX0_14810 [Citricoccus parietis]|uniref:Uncharacterized protein n=1 Tax=Citricoccus parietis TaxID=592307 RepID=A0ABV5G0D0_9MICC
MPHHGRACARTEGGSSDDDGHHAAGADRPIGGAARLGRGPRQRHPDGAAPAAAHPQLVRHAGRLVRGHRPGHLGFGGQLQHPGRR